MRSILTLVSLAFGIFIIIIGVGLNLGMERHIIKIMRDVEISDYKLYEKGYFDDKFENSDDRLDFMISNEASKIIDNYQNSKRIVFQGTLSTSSFDSPVNIIGGNQQDEEDLFHRNSYLIDGKNGVVLGVHLAKTLNLSVGDSFILKGTTKKGSLNAKDFVITGIIKSGLMAFDNSTILISKQEIETFTEASGFNDVSLKGEITIEDKEALKSLGVDVIGYREELEDLISISQLKIKITFIFGSIILLMSSVGIINTMLMAMLERKKEIGILMANGIKQNVILKLFIFEGALMGTLGSIVGFILGGSLLYYYQIVGIALPEVADKMGTTIPLSDRIYGYFDWRLNILFLIFGIFIAVISSFYPAYKATKLEPIDVIWDR